MNGTSSYCSMCDHKQCYVHCKTGGQCAGVCHVMLATQHIGHLVANMHVGNKMAFLV